MEDARKVSRRDILVVGGGAAAAVGALSLSPLGTPLARQGRRLVAAQPWARGMLSLGNGSHEEWLAQVGSVFSVGGGTSLRLAGVQPLQSNGPRPAHVARRRAFMAVFDVQDGQTMPGDLIYTASHPQYGPLQIFLSASVNPRTPGRMFAVFN